ncbi:MAG: hypothetical protein HYZ13_10125 [Acidobacteria bacterium]|nr:hypothetical protein [Acidobacteriota bacterium]
MGAGFMLAVGLTILIGVRGVNQNLDSVTMPVAGRTLNQFMAIVLTCIALIVPLTANLYSPKLVTLYVRHPLIVVMLSVLLASQILCLLLNFVPAGHRLNRAFTTLVSLIYLSVMVGALPFLYGISRFLRPDFFMPMLTKKGIANLKDLRDGRKVEFNSENLIETIDVVANIALTGLNRGDRQLVLLALQSLNVLLLEIIGNGGGATAMTWRSGRPHFIPGVVREGQDFLTRERVWPEAYVLGQGLKIMEASERRQQEMVSEFASHLVSSAGLAFAHGQGQVVELHVMSFNALFRRAVESKDLRRFQNISYSGRLLVEALQEDPYRMLEVAGHIIHYARLAHRAGIPNALETVIYDMGELALSLGSPVQERAVELVQICAGPLWQEGLAPESPQRRAAWRTVLRVFWEAKAAGLHELADAIYWRFLIDEPIHKEQLELLIEENRELHFEFNDRLLRFAFLSPAAVKAGQEFLQSW